MGAPSGWVLASDNPHKLRELAAIADASRLRLKPQSELGIESPPETGRTFVENALIKARHAAALSGEPAIADDSGLLVAALGGAPGILSARFAGEGAGDRANCGKLLAALHDVPEGRRGAQFVCVMVALLAADDPAPRICCGRWSGQVALAPRGSNGFGYDPLFIDPEHGMTAAELPADVKNRISHRARAWTALCAALAEAPREPG